MNETKFKTQEEYLKWAQSQDWYQSITLSCGYKTPGNVDSEKRLDIFSRYEFRGKRVLDIGCNSGLYCLMSKNFGAKEVVGVDINQKRIEQAKIIAANENKEIKYFEKGIHDITDLGEFDIVICIAVLTEIPDLLGAIEKIKEVTKEFAIIEMDIANPLIYIPSARKMYRLIKKGEGTKVNAEARNTKKGWFFSPSMNLLKNLFGEEFIIKDLGKNLRYRLLEIKRKENFK